MCCQSTRRRFCSAFIIYRQQTTRAPKHSTLHHFQLTFRTNNLNMMITFDVSSRQCGWEANKWIFSLGAISHRCVSRAGFFLNVFFFSLRSVTRYRCSLTTNASATTFWNLFDLSRSVLSSLQLSFGFSLFPFFAIQTSSSHGHSQPNIVAYLFVQLFLLYFNETLEYTTRSERIATKTDAHIRNAYEIEKEKER